MPARPPSFHPPGWREREPWQRSSGQKTKRKRGRAGQRDRKQVLFEEPFCRECLKNGLKRASDVVDHTTPLAEGGSDDRTNKQGLCNPCHDAKTKREARRGRNHSGPEADD